MQGLQLESSIDIAINYDHASIRCPFYSALGHKVTKCLRLKKLNTIENNLQSLQIESILVHQKKELVLNKDGFQLVIVFVMTTTKIKNIQKTCLQHVLYRVFI